MKKIISLFKRDGAVLTEEYHPDAMWVVNGEGVATRKWDGTAVLIKGGVLWARYDAKHGKTPPEGFVPAQEPDPITGHRPGWVPATRPEDKWIREACGNVAEWADGTYEALGPKIGANAEQLDKHILMRHGIHRWLKHEPTHTLDVVPRDLAGLKAFFAENDVEGIVWWRSDDVDCDKVKITGAALGVYHANRQPKGRRR